MCDQMVLRAGVHEFVLAPHRPLLMGIINTNPGSFSDATGPGDTAQQLATALQQVEDGADIIDVGFDSGVTYSPSIPLDQQVTNGMPLVEALVQQGIPVSIDTAFPEIAREGLDRGAALVNDVSGLAEPAVASMCAERDAALAILHTRAPHKTEHWPNYENVTDDVVAFLDQRRQVAYEAGVDADQVLLDPGFDYTKKPHETVEVIRQMDAVAGLGSPFLFGISRKYFAGIITGAEPNDRLPETLATLAALRSYPSIMRVHDVAAARRFLDVAQVLDGSVAFPAYTQDADNLKWVRRP